MPWLLKSLFRPPRRRTAGRWRLECLEDRSVPSLTPVGGEFPVNSFTSGSQGNPRAAVSAGGTFVVVWQGPSEGLINTGIDVYARLFDASGVPRGAEFRVNSYPIGHQSDPDVVMGAAGDFVVAWSSYGQDGSGSGVYAQRYNSAGAPQGPEFRVNVETVGHQSAPAVAMDAAGRFAITYRDAKAFLLARRYSVAGVPLGGELRVNQTPVAETFYRTDVAMDAAGGFVVVWHSYETPRNGLYSDVYARRFGADGAPQGNEFRVNTVTAFGQRNPAVAASATGDFVVAWMGPFPGIGYGVYARRYSAAGAPLGDEFRISPASANGLQVPAVGMDAAGTFVVAWTGGGSPSYRPLAREYTAAGLPVLDRELVVNPSSFGDLTYTEVAMAPNGNAVALWLRSDGSSSGVYGQRYIQAAESVPPSITAIYDDERIALKFGQTIMTAGPAAMTIAFSENLSQAGGPAGPNSVTNPTNYRLTRNGQDVSALVAGVTFGPNPTTTGPEAVLTFRRPLPTGDYLLTVRSALQDVYGNALFGGSDYVLDFTVAPVRAAPGGFVQTSTITTGTRYGQRIARDAAGNYVVVWHAPDGSANGIYARRYSAAGVPQGNEFRVNTVTASYQWDPDVAMDPNGNFVVAWQSYSQGGGSDDIVAQRYSVLGAPVGDEFRVNQFTTGYQRSAAVAVDAAGDFVIAWES